MYPCYVFKAINKKDLLQAICRYLTNKKVTKLKSFNHHYMKYNVNVDKARLSSSIARRKSTFFIGLRIGHTKMSHEHIFNRTLQDPCLFCNGSTSVQHILDECKSIAVYRTALFGSDKPSMFLMETSDKNVEIIYEFIYDIGIVSKI